jgi:hypothetical protein
MALATLTSLAETSPSRSYLKAALPIPLGELGTAPLGVENADLRPHPWIQLQFQRSAREGSWRLGPELSASASWFVSEPTPLVRLGLGPWVEWDKFSARFSLQYQFTLGKVDRLETSPFWGSALVSEFELAYQPVQSSRGSLGVRGIDPGDRALRDLESIDTDLIQNSWIVGWLGLNQKVFGQWALDFQLRWVNTGSALILSDALAIGLPSEDYWSGRIAIEAPIGPSLKASLAYWHRWGTSDPLSFVYLSPHAFDDHDLQSQKVSMELVWQF